MKRSNLMRRDARCCQLACRYGVLVTKVKSCIASSTAKRSFVNFQCNENLSQALLEFFSMVFKRLE